MVLVGEVCTLAGTGGLSDLAARQQRQLEAQQQQLAAREQRLQVLKQREARLAQEVREATRKRSKALRSQLEQQAQANHGYSKELERARALFAEKERELSAAAARAEDLTRQLEAITRAAGWFSANASLDLEKIRRELAYRQKVSEQQATRITQQKEMFAKRKHELSLMDQKIADLQQRLHRKRMHNQQLSRPSPAQPDVEFTQDDAKLPSPFAPNKNDPKYQTLPYNIKFPAAHMGETKTASSAITSQRLLSKGTETSSSPIMMMASSSSSSSLDGFVPIISPPIYSTAAKSNAFKNNGTTFALKATLMKPPPPQAKDHSPPTPPKANGLGRCQEAPSELPEKPPVVKKPVVPPKPFTLRQSTTTDHSVEAALAVLKAPTAETGENKPSKFLQPASVDEGQKKELEDASPPELPNLAMIDPPPRHGPIRPKPLTIKKHLGEQPPRLKSALKRDKTPPPLPSAFLFPDKIPEPANKTLEVDGLISQLVADIEKATGDLDLSRSDSPEPEERTEGDGDSGAFMPVSVPPPVEEVPRKGNLKSGNGGSKHSRRVSFDPVALLLDAALEGELNLVMKTAEELPNPSAANDEGITALHNAICAGHFDIVTFLVDFGCDVNSPDSDGWTPLHCAASCNNLPMVKFLVEKGACIFAATLSDQETAADKCEEDQAGFDGCSEYLYGIQDQLGVVNGGKVYGVFDYAAQNEDELSFSSGEQLEVLRRGDDVERLWWWCRNSREQEEEGYVPRNLLGLYPRVTKAS